MCFVFITELQLATSKVERESNTFRTITSNSVLEVLHGYNLFLCEQLNIYEVNSYILRISIKTKRNLGQPCVQMSLVLDFAGDPKNVFLRNFRSYHCT